MSNSSSRKASRARASSSTISESSIIGGPSRPWRRSVASTPAASTRIAMTPVPCSLQAAMMPALSWPGMPALESRAALGFSML